ALAKGYKQVVKLLLKASTKINTLGRYYSSALYATIVEGYEDTIRLLLKNNANVTSLDV
ncbi:hypothetical protein CC80DRAFT_432450, partial [Byssothecium circinans]